MNFKELLKPCPVVYESSNHSYTLVKNGKLVPGVTTVIGLLNKPFLMPWAAKMVAEHLADKQEAIKTMSPTEYNNLLIEAKMSYRRKSQEALESGTLAHAWCESYVKAKMEGLKQPSYAGLDPVAKNCVKAFLGWTKQHDVTWLASELIVGSEVHEFGGTLDAIATVDGHPCLIDFKTSNQISKDYFIQTAAYELALEEMGVKVWQRIILRIPKDGKDFEALTVPTPLDLDRETFLALRQVQKFESYVANLNNEVVDQRGKVLVKQTINK